MSKRPAALAACAVLAVILNAGAIGIATGVSPRWNGVAALPSEHTQRATMALIAVADEPPVPAVSHDARASTGRMSSSHRSPASSAAARTRVTAATAEPPQQVLFYSFREVDSPAFPESDWNLDVASLDEVGVQRLVFEVLVSDRGEVVGCTVLDPPDLADDVKRGLEKRLSETSLLPALRAGQLVASVRRIELLVAAAPPETQADMPARQP